jgi:hypothetical protein
VGKLYNFLLGVVVGFGLYHAASNFHLIYAKDGLHFIRKSPPRLAEVYVDVRDFDTQQWLAHPELVVAIEKAGKRDILQQAALDAVHQALEQAIPQSE